MTTFGSRVIGEEKFRHHQRMKEAGALHFGKRVVSRPAPEPDPAPEPVQKAERRELTAEALKDELRQHPQNFDSLFAAEFTREGGPRPTALREFLAIEIKRKGGPRAEVIKAIEEGLG